MLDTSAVVQVDSQLDLLADALGDPTRRAIFKYVAEADEPVTATDVGETFGVHRTVARAHLEKLTESGLLLSDFLHRPEGGRPPKVYRRSDTRLDLQEPARQYRMLAELLLHALERFGEAGEVFVDEVGRDFGRRLAADVTDTSVEARLAPLSRAGAGLRYEMQGDRVVVHTGNCLFREVATRRPRLVCLLDRAIIAGLLSSGGRNYELREHLRRTDSADSCALVFDAGDAAEQQGRSENRNLGTTSTAGRESEQPDQSGSEVTHATEPEDDA